ncbi:uncharacterized protein RJT20DRAFT_155997 [Scheffersomyces xylosifermentans]|uniref:uncharacterized protein n=1 Tax=Scheffersomyces xylosifermentans TaxID=1304137 RepID=UPI00315DF085
MSGDLPSNEAPGGVAAEDSIAMFMDPDFNPSNYIDKLFQSITSSTASAVYSKNSLSKLSNDVSHLITHLDYFTNELSNNSLRQTFETLNNSNLLILHGNKDDVNDSNVDLTRLQYYINVLNNSILTLSGELKSINEDIAKQDQDNESGSRHQNESINDLIQLKSVKSNLTSVLSIFEFLNSVLTTDLSSSRAYGVEEFSNILNSAFETIKIQVDGALGAEKERLTEHINQLIELNSLFVNLKNFHPIYKKFVGKLIVEKEQLT